MSLGTVDLALDALLDVDHPIKAAAAEWAAGNLADPTFAQRERDCTFWAEGFRRIAAFGALGIMAPPELGGGGGPLAELLLTLEGLGYGCEDYGLVFAAGAQVLSTQNALQRFGTAQQQQRYLAPLLRAERRGAFCMSEPESGSDAFALTTTAERCSDGFVLHGHKCWITFAPVADFFVVFAKTDPSAGQWGVSAFLVDSSTPGVSVSANREKMGLRTTPFGDVVLDGCTVPEENLLGPIGAGASMFSAVLEDERAFLFAAELGAMERLLHTTVAFARDRRQFGQRIAEFQAVSHKLADMKLRHETARTMLYKTALLAAAGRSITMASALTKMHATENALTTAVDAVRVHGAKGYVSEFGIERQVREALGGLFTSGTSDVQRNIVARLLGL
ncbi:MAG: acyl-CoA dehydrogenase [Acidimicrobiales bacterium]|nr:acyl-CoA dehydrogenase [Acidimicrobiales bacterium]